MEKLYVKDVDETISKLKLSLSPFEDGIELIFRAINYLPFAETEMSCEGHRKDVDGRYKINDFAGGYLDFALDGHVLYKPLKNQPKPKISYDGQRLLNIIESTCSELNKNTEKISFNVFMLNGHTRGDGYKYSRKLDKYNRPYFRLRAQPRLVKTSKKENKFFWEDRNIYWDYFADKIIEEFTEYFDGSII